MASSKLTNPRSLRELFLELRAARPEDRPSLLSELCGDRPEVKRQVEGMLQLADRDDANPLDEVAASLSLQERLSGLESEVIREDTIVGPYKLIEQIGEGGMGVVFKARQEQPIRRSVAVKIIKPGMDSRRVIARFEAERQALAMMNHPHIAKVFDAGTTESGRPFFVMELVKGVPINDFCDQRQLTLEARLQLFLAVCQAVEHAHQKGVIHRDLKPSNILVELHDVTYLPKIIDFGIAKAIGEPLTEKTLETGFTQLVGTPMYMSPEQAELNSLDVDTRSDIYSLGVLLYELVTGTTPFDRETFRKAGFDEVRRMIREQEPLRPSKRISTLAAGSLSTISQQRMIAPQKLAPSIRGDLDWIVVKALEKDRKRRYQSVASLANDVQHFLQGEAVEAHPPSLIYQLQKSFHRHRFALTAAIVLSIVALVSGVLLFSENRKTAEALSIATEQQTRAEQHLQFALEAVDDMYVDIATRWLSTEAAPTNFQRTFLRRAAEFYQRIIELPRHDLQDRLRAATALERYAIISHFLVEDSEAIRALNEAIQLSEIATADPNAGASYQIDLLRRFHQRASILLDQGDLEAAERDYASGAELLSSLRSSNVEPSDYLQVAVDFEQGWATCLLHRDDLPQGSTKPRFVSSHPPRKCVTRIGSIHGFTWPRPTRNLVSKKKRTSGY